MFIYIVTAVAEYVLCVDKCKAKNAKSHKKV